MSRDIGNELFDVPTCEAQLQPSASPPGAAVRADVGNVGRIFKRAGDGSKARYRQGHEARSQTVTDDPLIHNSANLRTTYGGLKATGTARGSIRAAAHHRIRRAAQRPRPTFTDSSTQNETDRTIGSVCFRSIERSHGGSCRTRTYNPLIKSQLLCQLS